MKLFEEYVEAKGDVKQIILNHKQQLCEAQRSQIRYGLRGEKWVPDTHGDTKGEKIIQRKKSQGLKPDYTRERERERETERERERERERV